MARKLSLATEVVVTLPQWLVNDIKAGRLPDRLTTKTAQMKLAIWLSKRNAEEGTGGPFASVVVETETGRLKGVGVNRVVPLKNSVLHGETVAIMMAEKAVGSFTLGGDGMPRHSLITNAQPCAMCAGAIPWCGVAEVATGASGYNVETYTGFDEGPINPNWRREFGKRGIKVVQGLMRREACAVLRWYKNSGGVIYNGRQVQTPPRRKRPSEKKQ
jgi:tRNA(Arg) A34 adenosine deaminase TadA